MNFKYFFLAILISSCTLTENPNINCNYIERKLSIKEELIIQKLKRSNRNVLVDRINYEYRFENDENFH